MNIIYKKAIKDFKNLGWRSYLMIATVILSLGGGLGLYYSVQTALPMMNLYFDDANHADYVYELSDDTWISQSQLDGLNSIKEVDDYTGRLFWNTFIQLPHQDEKKYLLLVGLEPNGDKVDVYDYSIIKGENFDKDNIVSAIIDSKFSEANDIDVGDKIEIDGLYNAKLEISGTFNAPEFTMLTSNPDYLFPIEGSMGVLFLSKDSLKNYIINYLTIYNSSVEEDLTNSILYFKSVDYNNIAVTFNGDISNGNDIVEDYLEKTCGVQIVKSEKFEDSYAYDLMKSDVQDSGEVMSILMYFMAFMGAIIVYIIFNRYVNSQKQQIGFLLGLGYSRKDILKYFGFNVALMSLIAIPAGILLGFGLGYVLMSVMFAEITNLEMFTFPFIFSLEILLMGLIIGAILIFSSTFFSVRKINKTIIGELIYGQSEISRHLKKPKKTTKSRDITNRLVLRNLFRNKKRLIFSVVAMSISLLIVSATQSLLDSMLYNVDRTFKDENSNVEPNERWDLNVLFQSSINSSSPNNLIKFINKIDGIDDIEIYSKGLVKANAKGDKEDQMLSIQGIDLNNDKFHKFTWQGDKHLNSEPEDDDEIVISSVHALKLGKELGEKVTLVDSTGEESKFKIVGVHSELLTTAYITFDAGEKLFHGNNTLVDGLYIILKDDADKKEVKDAIYKLGNIEVVFDAEEMNEKIKEFMENYTVILYVIIFYTLIVSFFIVFYNSIMNVYDKEQEFGILRSLGYSKKKVFKIILFENLLQSLFPIFLALVFTYPLALQMGQIYQENFPLEVFVGPLAILLIIIPTIILYTLGSFLGLKTIYKKDLYEQVQTRYVG